jgi:hypothetical protein
MKKLLAAVVAASALFAAPAAFADTMTNLFGNTVTTTGADGVTLRWAFNQDNTYTVILPDGATGTGTWAIEGDQLCVTPGDGSARQCAGLAADKNVGDSWTTTNDAGESVTVSIVAGR